MSNHAELDGRGPVGNVEEPGPTTTASRVLGALGFLLALGAILAVTLVRGLV